MERLPEKSARTASTTTNSAIDLAKFVCSMFVVAIHGSIDIGVFTPIFRAAVPFFFLCSGFFLFSKLARAESRRAERKILGAFVRRNVVLYLFWLVVQSPIVFRGWSGLRGTALLTNLLGFLQRLFFGNTFGASWYLSAMVIGCCLFYFLSLRLSNRVLLVIGAAGYAACLMFSSYNGFFEHCVPVNFLYIHYNRIFLSVVNGIPAGFLWIALGKHLADTPYTAKKRYVWMAVAGVAGLVLEHRIVTELDLQHLPDCYIMLIPICYGVFQFLRGSAWRWRGSIRLRNMSTVIYVSHGTLLSLLWQTIDGQWLRFGVVLLICIGSSLLLFMLEKHKWFSWLKCVY